MASKILQEGKHCSICLTDIERKHKECVLKCTHIYHIQCIELWIQTQNTCPICREVIPIHYIKKQCTPEFTCMFFSIVYTIIPIGVFIAIIVFIGLDKRT